MIPLSPLPDYQARCVHDKRPLRILGWSIPGMRSLARLSCLYCNREYFGDLPIGQALATPRLLEVQTGQVHDLESGQPSSDWFGEWLRTGYRQRGSNGVTWTVETHRSVRRPLLLNCLDALYGHSLLTLLNVRRHLGDCSEWDVIALVPQQLRWLVPEGVAETWSFAWSFSNGTAWNDALAGALHERVRSFRQCALSRALPHPHPEEWDIEQFTGVRPKTSVVARERIDRPVVTFVWRDDRTWPAPSRSSRVQRVVRKMGRRVGLIRSEQRKQQDRFVAIAEQLRSANANVDVAFVGLGQRQSGLPDWIADHRTLRIDAATEQAWCQRYARSHVVVGVHGSNMLLPSAHAGAVVELVPRDRWGNLMQDILLPERDPRTFALRCRLLPEETPPATVAEIVATTLSVPEWIPLCAPKRCLTILPSP